MNIKDQAYQTAWRVHGLDYYGPCWPLGGGWFLFCRMILGAWGHAVLEGAQGRSRLRVVPAGADSVWLLGHSDHPLAQASGAPLASAGASASHYLSALDATAPPLTALPPAGGAPPFLGLDLPGAVAALFSVRDGQWHREEPEALLSARALESAAAPGWSGYQPEGVPGLVEAIIARMGEDPQLARRGRRAWTLRQGTAVLHLCYSEERAMLSAEVHLVRIGPHSRRKALMAYVLQENVGLSGYGFSIQEETVIIALALPARFLQEKGTASLLQDLLERCDAYDNVLVSRFNAEWLTE